MCICMCVCRGILLIEYNRMKSCCGAQMVGGLGGVESRSRLMRYDRISSSDRIPLGKALSRRVLIRSLAGGGGVCRR